MFCYTTFVVIGNNTRQHDADWLHGEQTYCGGLVKLCIH